MGRCEKIKTKSTVFSWLKQCQAKPMALPVEVPDKERDEYSGVSNIDAYMSPETASWFQEQLNPAYLGSGQNGIAIAFPNGDAGKITTRKKTADAAEYVRYRAPASCARVYDVIQIQEDPPLWLITMEQVMPLTKFPRYEEANDYFGDFTTRSPQVLADTVSLAKSKLPGYEQEIDEISEFHQRLMRDHLRVGDPWSANIGFNSAGKIVLLDFDLLRIG